MTTQTLDTAKTQTVLERCVCMLLKCGYLGNHRRVQLDGVEMSKDGDQLNGEKDELNATWRLFANKDLKPCDNAIHAVKAKLRSMSVDGGMSLFGDGAYLLPLLGVPEAEQAIQDGRAVLATKVEELVARLDVLIEERRAKLGKMFVRSAYPTPEDIRAAYRIRYSYVRFGAPDRLEEVDAAVAERAKQDWNAQLASAYDEVVVGLRFSALKVMQELADRLRPGEDGKPKALRATALRDLQELLGHLPVLNSVAEDDALPAALAGVGGFVQGVTVETLRDAPAVRAMMLAKVEETVASLDGLVSSGRRAMTLV